jgi:anti-anti-sigma regulatory factor
MLGRALWSVTLNGEHDLATLPIVDEAFQRTAGSETLIVDVRGATILDSAIMGALLVVPER